MRAARRLFTAGNIAAAAFVLVTAACVDAPSAPASVPPLPAGTAASGYAPPAAQLSAAGLTLPYFGSVSYGGSAFKVENTGTGTAGEFVVRGTTGYGAALVVRHYGLSNVGVIQAENQANPTVALQVTHRGSGTVIQGATFGTGTAGLFQISSSTNAKPAVVGETRGTGSAGSFRITSTASLAAALHAATDGVGPAGSFQISNAAGGGAALSALTNGTGPALLANHTGASGSLALFQNAGVTQIRFAKNGRGYFNGGTQSNGADVAETFEVEGDVAAYAPGDVLTISTASDRRVEKSAEAYSTRVIGVYATKPGVLLSERSVDEDLDDMIPVGVVGVIPTRVTAENGAIRRGDLLTTATRPGHAMKAQPITVNGVRFYPAGVILGKALEEFDGTGSGLIRVLVNVK